MKLHRISCFRYSSGVCRGETSRSVARPLRLLRQPLDRRASPPSSSLERDFCPRRLARAQYLRRGGPPAYRRPAGDAPQISAAASRSGDRSHIVRRPLPVPRGYEDATKYRDFLEAKVFPSEQTTFWKRPFFVNTIRFAWCVIGAHALAPITTHDLNRFERYSVPDAKFEARLPELFPAFLEAARRLDIARQGSFFN